MQIKILWGFTDIVELAKHCFIYDVLWYRFIESEVQLWAIVT